MRKVSTFSSQPSGKITTSGCPRIYRRKSASTWAYSSVLTTKTNCTSESAMTFWPIWAISVAYLMSWSWVVLFSRRYFHRDCSKPLWLGRPTAYRATSRTSSSFTRQKRKINWQVQIQRVAFRILIKMVPMEWQKNRRINNNYSLGPLEAKLLPTPVQIKDSKWCCLLVKRIL